MVPSGGWRVLSLGPVWCSWWLRPRTCMRSAGRWVAHVRRRRRLAASGSPFGPAAVVQPPAGGRHTRRPTPPLVPRLPPAGLPATTRGACRAATGAAWPLWSMPSAAATAVAATAAAAATARVWWRARARRGRSGRTRWPAVRCSSRRRGGMGWRRTNRLGCAYARGAARCRRLTRWLEQRPLVGDGIKYGYRRRGLPDHGRPRAAAVRRGGC